MASTWYRSSDTVNRMTDEAVQFYCKRTPLEMLGQAIDYDDIRVYKYCLLMDPTLSSSKIPSGILTAIFRQKSTKLLIWLGSLSLPKSLNYYSENIRQIISFPQFFHNPLMLLDVIIVYMDIIPNIMMTWLRDNKYTVWQSTLGSIITGHVVPITGYNIHSTVYVMTLRDEDNPWSATMSKI